MLAIFITSLTYVGFGIICGATVLRAATGSIDDLYNGTIANCTDGSCDWGLQNSFQVFTFDPPTNKRTLIYYLL